MTQEVLINCTALRLDYNCVAFLPYMYNFCLKVFPLPYCLVAMNLTSTQVHFYTFKIHQEKGTEESLSLSLPIVGVSTFIKSIAPPHFNVWNQASDLFFIAQSIGYLLFSKDDFFKGKEKSNHLKDTYLLDNLVFSSPNAIKTNQGSIQLVNWV